MDHYPSIGDIYKWPTSPEKFFLVVDYAKYYAGETAMVCLELGTENCYSQFRVSDLSKIGQKVG